MVVPAGWVVRMTMEFRLLGALEVWQGNRLLRLGGPNQRALLAMLLLRAGQVVPVDQLIDALWDQDPPASARTIVHGYVSKFRKFVVYTPLFQAWGRKPARPEARA
jgi:DNA-binding SARP family transcriptional activator